MLRIKKSDVFWLRISAIREPGFYPGAPWRVCQSAYDRLEKRGFVKRVPSDTIEGMFFAVATKEGHEMIEWIRRGNLYKREQQAKGDL